MNHTNPPQIGLSPQAADDSICAATQDAGRKRRRTFAILAILLTIAFAGPLWSLMRLALKEDIQSHILLIPFIFVYLWKTSNPRPFNRRGIKGEGDRHRGEAEVSISPAAFQNPQSAIRNPQSALSSGSRRAPLPRSALRVPRSVFIPVALAALCGLAALAAYWFWGKAGRIPHNDALSLATASFLCLMLATALSTIGWAALRPRLFAVAFLVFMIPLPLAFIEFMSIGLQLASAEAADWMLSLTGMPMFRQGLVFQFPMLSVRVAEECSGVRSTFVLFITSVLAGHLFLRTGWKKLFLALAIFPLGVLRNGFRITAISWLTVNVDAGIIEGPLHHRGGPIFFVLSLVPLFGLLWLLRRSDFRRAAAKLDSPRTDAD